MTRLRWLVVSVLLAISGVFVGLAALIWVGQERLIYFPRTYGRAQLKDFVEKGGKRLEFNTGEGDQVAYLLHGGAPEKTRRLWLVFGGNGALALDWQDILFADRLSENEAFLLVDYPGYGECEGGPTPKSIAESTAGALAASAEEMGIPAPEMVAKLAALGQSLGAAAALQAAETYSIDHVVLVSPFTTMGEMARRSVGWPLCLMLRHRFDNRERLAALEGARVAVFHGDADRVIPFRMSEQLATEFPETVTLTRIPHAGHNDVFHHGGVTILEAMRTR